ncbi:MAG: hypothetical protein ABFS14_05695, partial [Gemmatimonadota bacterium]
AVLLVAILVVGCQSGAGDAAAQAMEGARAMEFPRIGLGFDVPDGFLVGRFSDGDGIDTPFKNAVVLVQPEQLLEFELEAIPVGDIPAVWVDRPRPGPSIIRRSFEADSTFTVAAGQVWRYPGYPGPYGDQAFYYIVEVGEGEFVEVMGHRTLFRADDMGPSHYDEAILVIIHSLHVTR